MIDRTIVDVLAERSDRNPDGTAFVFLDDRGEETGQITYSEVFKRANSFANRLEGYAAQARIGIILPSASDFAAVFLGCLLGGKIAVPLAAPNNHRVAEMLVMLDDCQPSCIVTTRAIRTMLQSKLSPAQSQSLDMLAVEDLSFDDGFTCIYARQSPIALLQYTSGSTSRPKGVIISHANIMANQSMIKDAFGLDPSKTVVGWTPLHHDQGLIGNLLHPLYIGTKCVLMPPIAFLRSPLLWLQTITKYKGHTSGGPNFAYNLCIDRYRGSNVNPDIDLSSWKVAFNGAEPVSASTIRRFSEAFEPHGFDAGAMFPCYGMAEATLFVSGGPVGRGAVLLDGDKSGRQPNEQELVCAGPVHREMSVLVHHAPGHECTVDAPAAGEICIAGPNVTRGYWNRNSDDFIDDPQSGIRYLKTGDLGFLRDEGLYITGRKKELMIVRGRNIYPYDVERTIVESHQHANKGGCAVFSAAKGGDSEEIFAVQEIDRVTRKQLDYEELAGIIRKNVTRNHQIMLKRVYFVNLGAIPRTTSGKIRRAELASLLHERLTEHGGIVAAC